MKPPRNRVLRAMWRSRQLPGLSPLASNALFTIWAFGCDEPKPFGPTMLAYLINTTAANAKQILKRLRKLGYIETHGQSRSGRGRVASRQLTAKAKMPPRTKNGTMNPATIGKGAQRLPQKGAQALPMTYGQDEHETAPYSGLQYVESEQTGRRLTAEEAARPVSKESKGNV